MFARPSSVKLVGQYIVITDDQFDCSFREQECALLRAIEQKVKFLFHLTLCDSPRVHRKLKEMEVNTSAQVWQVNEYIQVISKARGEYNLASSTAVV